MKLSPPGFVQKYWKYAQQTQKKTDISAVAILAQAAVESRWGERAAGNMFFGIKAKAADLPRKRQLLITTEYLKSLDQGHRFPAVIAMAAVKPGLWKYRVKDWFRRYRTAKGSFDDHAHFFLTHPRYAAAVRVGADPLAFLREVARAGYATDPNYFDLLAKVVRAIERHRPDAAVARVSTAFGGGRERLIASDLRRTSRMGAQSRASRRMKGCSRNRTPQLASLAERALLYDFAAAHERKAHCPKTQLSLLAISANLPRLTLCGMARLIRLDGF